MPIGTAARMILGLSPSTGVVAEADYRLGLSQPVVVVSRASGAAVLWPDKLVEFGPNSQRVTNVGLLLEGSSTNFCANPRFEGGTPGVIGSGGVWPADMDSDSPGGITRQIVGFGSEDNIPFVDFRWFGTPTASTNAVLTFAAAGGWVCSLGQTFALSLCVRLVGGSLANITNTCLRVQERQGSSVLTNVLKPVFTPDDSPLRAQRRSDTHTIGQAAADNARLIFGFSITEGQPVDVTFRFGLPQVEDNSVVTSPILPPVGSSAVSTRAAESAVMQVPGSDRNVRLLVQDLTGAEWRTVAMSGGVIPLQPRAGQRSIQRARVWDIGVLTPEQEAALAVPA